MDLCSSKLQFLCMRMSERVLAERASATVWCSHHTKVAPTLHLPAIGRQHWRSAVVGASAVAVAAAGLPAVAAAVAVVDAAAAARMLGRPLRVSSDSFSCGKWRGQQP
eukprot:1147901-Pelagomonas_calceolata.AAC.10